MGWTGMERVKIEDDKGTVALSDEGYEVTEAADGAAALTLIDEIAPDLILLDMQMPTMDGWAFAQLYHQRPGPHVPVIVVLSRH